MKEIILLTFIVFGSIAVIITFSAAILAALYFGTSFSTKPRFKRDPEFECDEFEAGESMINSDCETDGHYLCQECRHREAEEDNA